MDGPSDTSPRPARSRLILIDGTNTLYRAFFALPPLRAHDGTPTHAALGFVNMLNKVIREEGPDHLAVVFDPRGKSFRHDLYPAYKATRDRQPEDLSAQLPLVRDLVEAYGIPMLVVDGFEADDVIASLVQAAADRFEIAIVSTDKDLMQLVREHVCMLDTMKDRRYTPAEVEARFGVPPERVLDLRALVGDPSDNIPGVRGIGEKGAAKLIQQWGSLETLLEHASDVSAARARAALEEQAEQARLSKQLATLRTDIPLPLAPEDLARREPDREKLRALFSRLGFTRLLEGLDAPGEAGAGAPEESRFEAQTRLVASAAELADLAEELAAQPGAVWMAVTDGGGPMEARPLGIACALGDGRAAYVACGGSPSQAGDALDFARVAAALRAALAGGQGRPWLGRDVKRLQALFEEAGAPLPLPEMDVEVAAFLLDPEGSRGLSAVAASQLGHKLRSWQELAGRGAKATPAAELPVAAVADWAGEQVCAMRALAPGLRARLERDGLAELLDRVEMPLTRVLARMECAGVRVDEGVLERLSAEYEKELSRLEGEIHALAGEKFLVSSPKQLQRILFEKLKLPVIRKTKTGYSTDEGVLARLAAHHELPVRILASRRLAKLKNTYVDALPPLVNPRTGRIHPTFHQSGAATGRLSAANPNVQNIPIRSEQGIRIREAFVPAEGKALVSADYSQVELRILAHYSADESLIEAFRAGEDIHRRTASEVLGIPAEQVSAEQRARAKAVNFGIIYGLSPFGLANQLGIASEEAQRMIGAYFERYHGVRRFIDETIAEARERGYVRTLLGRRRYLPDLGSRNRTLRNAAERVAVNTVIQGTEADLIKRAMVEVDALLASQWPGASMILQVHDELVFEVPERDVEALREQVCERMEQVLELAVPLRVDTGVGKNWREAH